jgi:hypothetical protein
MFHSKGLTVEVRGEQRLGMTGRRQIEGHKVRSGLPESSRLTDDSTRAHLASDIGGWARSKSSNLRPDHHAIALQPSTQTSRVIWSCAWKQVRRFRISREMLKPEARSTAQWISVDHDNGLPRAMVCVVKLDASRIFFSDCNVRHGISPFLFR